jgi:hypothetical protein
MHNIEIKVKGHVDHDWSDSLASLKVTHIPDGSTLLSGAVRDQAALYGLLAQLSNLGIQLISVTSSSLGSGRGVKA